MLKISPNRLEQVHAGRPVRDVEPDFELVDYFDVALARLHLKQQPEVGATGPDKAIDEPH